LLTHDELIQVNYPKLLANIDVQYSEDVANQFRELYEITVPEVNAEVVQNQHLKIKDAQLPVVQGLREDVLATIGPEEIVSYQVVPPSLIGNGVVSENPFDLLKKLLEHDEIVEFAQPIMGPLMGCGSLSLRIFPFGEFLDGGVTHAHVLLNVRYEEGVLGVINKMLSACSPNSNTVTIFLRGYNLPRGVCSNFKAMFVRLGYDLSYFQWGRWYSTDYFIQTLVPLNVKRKKF